MIEEVVSYEHGILDPPSVRNLVIDGVAAKAFLPSLKEFQNLEHLQITRTDLKGLPDLSFANLRTLILEDNRISSFPFSTIGLESLQILVLDEEITSVGDLSPLRSIRDLVIRAPQLQSLNPLDRCFEFCGNLETVEIEIQRGGLVPKGIAMATGLRNLILGIPRMEMLPDLSRLKKLERLSLANCDLNSLPSSLEECCALECLNARGNHLEALPTLPHRLSEILLSLNHFSSFPLELCELPELTEIDLSYNSISSLPTQVGQLRALKCFFLRKNRLTKLPEEFYGIDIEDLRVSGNPLKRSTRKRLLSTFKNTDLMFL